MNYTKDFYWLLPDYLAQKLDRMIDQYGNEAWFEKAWDILVKQYKQDPKAKWAPVEQVIDYCKRTYGAEPQLNDSITEQVNVAADEPDSLTASDITDTDSALISSATSIEDPQPAAVAETENAQHTNFSTASNKFKKKHRH